MPVKGDEGGPPTTDEEGGDWVGDMMSRCVDVEEDVQEYKVQEMECGTSMRWQQPMSDQAGTEKGLDDRKWRRGEGEKGGEEEEEGDIIACGDCQILGKGVIWGVFALLRSWSLRSP